MLDWIRENTQGWVVRLILALITIPFALFGIDSYINHRSADSNVATINGEPITRTEFDRALKQQQDQLANSLGAAASSVDEGALRHEVLNGLIRQHVLVAAARQQGMLVSDQQLAGFIAAIPAFQDNGQFNPKRYEQMLRNQGLSVPLFEQMVRDELLMQGMRSAFADAPQVARNSVTWFMQAFGQQREVSEVSLSINEVRPAITVMPAQIKSYYAAHTSDFTVPARAQFQYAVLSLDDFARHIVIDPAAVKQAYEQNQAQFSQPEQREARHILIAVSPGDNEQKRAAAKALAEHVYQLVLAHPDQFAALAKQYSNDPGSASQGGDLGWFARNAMVKPFADAVFAMRTGQISVPVHTDYGYHIIQLTAIRPAQTRSLADASAQITSQLQHQQAGTQFADAAERFSNQVFEQPAQLTATASSLHLPLQTSDWISRQGGVTGVLNQPKMLNALFSDDVMKRHHNTEAIEVTPNTLVAARLLAYQPAHLQPLDAVSQQISTLLRARLAQQQVAQQGTAMLAQLRAGNEPKGLQWSAFSWITRVHAQGVPNSLMTPVFAADASKLPAYVGGQDAQGTYHLIRVSRVQAPSAVDDAAKLQPMSRQLAQMQAERAFEDYQAGLLAKAKIEIRPQALNVGQ